jgi:hypothetical protein
MPASEHAFFESVHSKPKAEPALAHPLHWLPTNDTPPFRGLPGRGVRCGVRSGERYRFTLGDASVGDTDTRTG